MTEQPSDDPDLPVRAALAIILILLMAIGRALTEGRP